MRNLVLGLLIVLATPPPASVAQAAFLPGSDELREMVAARDVEALRQLGPEVMAPLVELYRGADVGLRAQIAAVFYGLGFESEAAREVMWADLDTSDRALRVQVQWAIGRVSDDERVVEALIERMLRDPNPLFRDKAACGLASDQIHLDEAQNLRLNKRLIELLESEVLETRKLVIRILRVRTGKDRGFRADAPPEARAKAVEAWRRWISRWGSPAAALESSLPRPSQPEVAAEPDLSALADLPFEEEQASGPDSFRVFRKARGSVVRTPLFRRDGSFSVEIRDVPGDGDFPELQGYFPQQTAGTVYVHFAFLVTDPFEPWNVALAGPRGFGVEKDGIAVWLQGREGELRQVSDGLPRSLLTLEAFTWYEVDLLLEVAAGRFDLTIFREGREQPVLSLRNQANAPGKKASAVELVSFIGDTGEDFSAVVYYVDNIRVAALAKVDLEPFAAPGRRRLFVELFGSDRAIASRQFGCFHAISAGDLGIAPAQLTEPLRQALERAIASPGPAALAKLAAPSLGQPALAEAVAQWQAGCALVTAKPALALPRFDRAHELVPAGRVFELARAAALAKVGRKAEAQELLHALARADQGDPRPAVLESMLALSRQDAAVAVAVLQPWIDFSLRAGSPASIAPAGSLLADEQWQALRAAWVFEQQFLNLLRANRPAEARALAAAVRQRLNFDPWLWQEREADAALWAGDAPAAVALYQAVLQGIDPEAADRILLKLADGFFVTGDLEQEKALREHVYGSLEAAEAW